MSANPSPAGKTRSSARPYVPLALCVLLVSLYAIASPAVYSRLSGQPRDVVGTLRAPRLSQREAELLRRGYYEDLIGVHNFNSQLDNILARRRDDQPLLHQTEAARLTGDFYGMELVPSTRIFFRGELYSINRWGMRDRDYALHRPQGVYRMAVLGSSQTNGWGVSDLENFESLLERRLNHEQAGQGHALERYELLNFAVPGYSTLQQVPVMENKIPPFQPQAVLFVAHPRDLTAALLDLTGKVRQRIPIPYEELRDVVRRAGVTPDTPETEARRLLRPFGEEIIAWAYRRITATCREQNMLPVWALLPQQLRETDWTPEDVARLGRLAREAGFHTVEVIDVYNGHDYRELYVAEWDNHPNRFGHQLIADRLYDQLRLHVASLPFSEAQQAQKPK